MELNNLTAFHTANSVIQKPGIMARITALLNSNRTFVFLIVLYALYVGYTLMIYSVFIKNAVNTEETIHRFLIKIGWIGAVLLPGIICKIMKKNQWANLILIIPILLKAGMVAVVVLAWIFLATVMIIFG